MSTLNVSNITDGVDTVETGYVINGSAKAWVSWSATGGTPTINGSLNASSMTDVNTGDAEANFTNAMSDAYFAVTSASTANSVTSVDGRTTSKFRARTISNFTTYVDYPDIQTAVHGDLA